MGITTRNPESLSMETLAVVLIAPHDARRSELASVVTGPQTIISHVYSEYPDFDGLSRVIGRDCDVAIVDLDADPVRAMDLVENICANHPLLTVMVYSSRKDPELLVECMRAGARELLTDPLLPATIAEAFVRAASRGQEVRRQKKVAGQVLVFTGAKGGSGVTTVASNFALALAQEGAGKVALVDLDLQLGDAALTLGMTPTFSIVDALRNDQRLDSEFLAGLLAKHESGLQVLAAPDEYRTFGALQDSAQKVLSLLRDDFAYVVIDAGSNFGSLHESLFGIADTIYLVVQVTIPALRNAHRLIAHFSALNGSPKLEVVLNRQNSRFNEIDDQSLSKALTQPPSWKIPNDYAAVRKAQNTGVALLAEDSAITRVFREMARAACGKPAAPVKKKRFSLFG